MPLFANVKGKYSLKEKEELLTIIRKNKLIYDEESGSTYFDAKRKKHVSKKPKEGFTSKSVREYYLDLKDVPGDNLNFQRARKMAQRCFADCKGDVSVDDGPPAKKIQTTWRWEKNEGTRG